MFVTKSNLYIPFLLEQVVLAYGAESDRKLGIPGEVRRHPIYFAWSFLLCILGPLSSSEEAKQTVVL